MISTKKEIEQEIKTCLLCKQNLTISANAQIVKKLKIEELETEIEEEKLNKYLSDDNDSIKLKCGCNDDKCGCDDSEDEEKRKKYEDEEDDDEEEDDEDEEEKEGDDDGGEDDNEKEDDDDGKEEEDEKY